MFSGKNIRDSLLRTSKDVGEYCCSFHCSII